MAPMSGKTKSEALFEAFCDRCRIQYNRVCTGEGKTPDYDICIKGRKVVVEVKQFDPNPEDIAAEKELAEKHCVVYGKGQPGDRVRKKITEAGPQISSRARGKYPSILVLYDNVPVALNAAGYNILVAMYGLEKYVFAVSRDPSKPLSIIDHRFGPEKKMTEEYNTSISAIGVLREAPGGKTEMHIYHNVFAAVELHPSLFAGLPVEQYVLEDKLEGRFRQWIKVVPGTDPETNTRD
jgi:hypothetical protein